MKIKCAYRAYLDFCRTIHVFNSELKNDNNINKKLKFAFVDVMCRVIIKEIDNKLLNFSGVEDTDIESTKIAFDKKHHEICKCIIDKTKEMQWIKNKQRAHYLNEELSYGQAQKWLNMTLKYMWMIGLLDENETLLKCLHVAVDRYILKTDLVKNDSDIDKSESWSKWTYEEDYRKSNYYSLQYNLRELVEIPFLWEHSAWIEIASKEKEIYQYRMDNETIIIDTVK